jgi:hypothetical protein
MDVYLGCENKYYYSITYAVVRVVTSSRTTVQTIVVSHNQ